MKKRASIISDTPASVAPVSISDIAALLEDKVNNALLRYGKEAAERDAALRKDMAQLGAALREEAAKRDAALRDDMAKRDKEAMQRESHQFKSFVGVVATAVIIIIAAMNLFMAQPTATPPTSAHTPTIQPPAAGK